MRSLLFAIACLTTSIILPTLAIGQDKLSNAKAAAQLLWSQVYDQGGTTLYCGTAFSEEGSQLVTSLIYSSKQMKIALGCITTRQCAIMDPRYSYMMSDLHNIYPALSRVELARRSAQFGELGANASNTISDIQCDIKNSFHLLEPRDQAKGNVARAIFYMHAEYGLPIVGELKLLKEWHRMDPPDAEEKARNDKIANLQGTRNRYIDKPELVEQQIKN